MNKTEQQLNRFNSLDFNAVLDTCINETEAKLFGLVQSQLLVGIKGNGEGLKDYAEQSYADFKKNIMNSMAPYFTPDLRFTGSFYDEFYQQQTLTGIEIDSKDWKASSLEKKYGSSIYQLTKENMEEYSQTVIFPILMEKLRKYLDYA